MKFFLFTYDLQALIIIITVIYSFKLIKNNGIVPYMKGFYLYPIVGFLVLIPHFLSANFNYNTDFAMTVNNISLIFHLSFLSFFIIRVIPSKNEKMFLYFNFCISLLVALNYLLKNISQQGNMAFLVVSLSLVISCITYYFTLFSNLPKINLTKEPAFWVVTGVFFAMSLQSPITTTLAWLRDKIAENIFYAFMDVINLSITIMYLFFIKAIVCSIQSQKTC